MDPSEPIYDEEVLGGISRRKLLERAAALGLAGSILPLLRDPAVAWAGALSEHAPARDQLTIAVSSTPPSWDQDLDSGPNTLELQLALQDTLLRWKPVLLRPSQPGGFVAVKFRGSNYERNLVPHLARSWESRGNTHTFHLRRGLRSHAGNELTSEDVRWTYERAFALKTLGYFLNTVSGLESINDVKIIDKYTVSFTLSQPKDVFFMALTLNQRGILDSTEMKKRAAAGDPWATQYGRSGDAGWGRYRVVTNQPGNQVIIEAVNNHYLGMPRVKRIVLKEVPSSSARVALLSRGAVDIATALQQREYAALKTNPRLKVWDLPGVAITSYQLQTRIPPLNKVAVRRALAYAAPYNDILRGVLRGFGRRAGGPILSNYPGYKPYFSQAYRTDLDKASALLKAAGLAGGFKTTIAYNVADPIQEQMSLLFQTNLDKIGVKADVESLTQAAYTTEVYGPPGQQGKFPIVSYNDGAAVPDPQYALDLFFRSTSPFNRGRYAIPGLDRLLDRQKKIPNFAKKAAMATQTQQLFVRYVPWIFVAEPGIQVASREFVSRLMAYPGYLNYEQFTAQ